MANDHTDSPVPLLIDDDAVVTDTQFDVSSPASNLILHRCSSASPNHADRAVAAAQAAFPAWRALWPYACRKILFRAADVLAAGKDECLRYQMAETETGRAFSSASDCCATLPLASRPSCARSPTVSSLPLRRGARPSS